MDCVHPVTRSGSSLPHKGTLGFENFTTALKYPLKGPGNVSDTVTLEQSSGPLRTRSAFIQLMFSFQTDLGLVKASGEIGVGEGGEA